MLWPMSCPEREGRCHGEGAKLSHWASIILSVAVSLGADLLRVGVFVEGYWLLAIGYWLLLESSSFHAMNMTTKGQGGQKL
jgi:hypothetical protein